MKKQQPQQPPGGLILQKLKVFQIMTKIIIEFQIVNSYPVGDTTEAELHVFVVVSFWDLMFISQQYRWGKIEQYVTLWYIWASLIENKSLVTSTDKKIQSDDGHICKNHTE